jgi:peptidyl-prolyl cis-trans isomerase C
MRLQRLVVCGLVALTAACGQSKTPTGQVVARVNGDEITTSELNLEIRTLKAQAGFEEDVHNIALQNIVDRRLLAQAASERSLDKDPEFALTRRRLEEHLLASLFVRRLLASYTPSDAEKGKFIASNPELFSDTTNFHIDEVIFKRPSAAVLAKVAEATYLEDIVRILKEASADPVRKSSIWRSEELPTEIVVQMKKLKPGEIFVIASADPPRAGAMLRATSAHLSPEYRDERAMAGVRNQKAEGLLRSYLAGARKRSSIFYQKGYSPASRGSAKETPPGA